MFLPVPPTALNVLSLITFELPLKVTDAPLCKFIAAPNSCNVTMKKREKKNREEIIN